MSLFKEHTQDEHRKSLADFLPIGKSFDAKNDQGSYIFNFLLGLSGELVRVEKLFNLVAADYGINDCTLLIESWEQAVGLPDDCFNSKTFPGAGSTIEERRRNVLIKIAQTFDTRESFEDFALNVMKIRAINIHNEWTPAANTTFPLAFPWSFTNAKIKKFTMVVELPTELAPSVFGIMVFPFPFSSGAASLIECIFRVAKPAICDIKFLYIL